MTTQDNFHLMTKGTFSKCELPTTAPDYISLNKKGNVSSRYWYTNDGVIRQSDHWGRVASCIWTLKGYSKQIKECEVASVELCGYVSFSDLEKSTTEFQNIVDEEVISLNELQILKKIEYTTYSELRRTKEGKIINSIFNQKINQLFNL